VFLDTEPSGEYTMDRVPFIDELVGYEAVMREAWFPIDDGFVELLEYSQPKPGQTDPETFNAGHMHFCLQVDDLEAEYVRLRDADIGIEFRSDGPITVPEDEPDFGGNLYLYLRTPDGSTFEFYQPVPA
jgi:catechol 2,3-dioxygenase-like lactoylglutathione lyase family enzyme